MKLFAVFAGLALYTAIVLLLARFLGFNNGRRRQFRDSNGRHNSPDHRYALQRTKRETWR